MGTGSSTELTILYGSQTGNAEFLAYNISESAKASGLSVELMTLNDALQQNNLDWQRLLVVTATHDNGHMPDNANGFWNWLHTCQEGQFAGLPYAVLAIGDSMYDDFCKAGIDFDTRFQQLGAEKILDRIDCDVDYDMTSVSWVKKFLETVPTIPAWNAVAIDDSQGSSADFVSASEEWHDATIIGSRVLTGVTSNKRVMHFDIALDDSFTYLPGDSVDVAIHNSPDLVEEWLSRFPDVSEVTFRGEQLKFTQALERHLELRLPHIGLIQELLTSAPENPEIHNIRELIESGDRDATDQWLWGKDVLDVINLFGIDSTTLPSFIDSLRPLQPRSYSIASSPTVTPGQLSLTVSLIDYEQGGRSHRGAGTSFLEHLAKTGASCSVRRVVAHEFRLPETNVPVIMIGPGVGIAPFIGFLQELSTFDSKPNTWLFFGDQRRDSDWLYRDELETWLEQGVLTKLCLAFSRDQAEKHYVQHDLLAEAEELLKWVDQGAHIYICGDKNHMAHDVEEALISILSNGGDLSVGKHQLDELKHSGRYAKDVY